MNRPDTVRQLLTAFEHSLNPRYPERSPIPARVLGYGEISTVLEIDAPGRAGGPSPAQLDSDPASEGKPQSGGPSLAQPGRLAHKRLPMFATRREADEYQTLYARYVETLQDQVGISVVPSRTLQVAGEGRTTVYIVQEKLRRGTMGHQAIHLLPPRDVVRLVGAVLRETKKVFDFNRPALSVGFDAQISNWAIVGFDPRAPRLAAQPQLVYFDTSSPLLSLDGEEQLNPDLFLRSAPSFLVWIIRLLFLEDVMTRYYDLHHVVTDLIANFYKEQRADLIPVLLDAANRHFAAEIEAGQMEPFTAREVRAYYREDAWIWRIYLAARKIDRTLHRMTGREYPYILPEKIKR